MRNLDQFKVYVRKCRRIKPDGYEVVLEICRKPASGEAMDRKPKPESQRPQGESEVLK